VAAVTVESFELFELSELVESFALCLFAVVGLCPLPKIEVLKYFACTCGSLLVDPPPPSQL
jgi:hypothetical protein